MDARFLQKTAALQATACDVVVCDSSWDDEATGRRIIHWRYRQRDCDAGALAYVVAHPIGVISALVRREPFIAAGGFDESAACWEDADLFVRLAERGARFRIVEETLVTSIRHARGISRDQHHCDRCRLAFLSGYLERHPAPLRPLLGAEVEKLIPRFLAHGDAAAAGEALALCRSVGMAPPTTSNRVMRALKAIVPPLWLFRLQHAYRRARARP
jgi:hypothetical protein